MGVVLRAYVETGVDLAGTGGVAAWSFDLSHWGRCGQGDTERQAVADLAVRCGRPDARSVEVIERIHGDEQAFERDLEPPARAEVEATMAVLDEVRPRTIELVSAATESALDRDDPARVLPGWASWRTPRQLAWHIADTESRYYLPGLRLPGRARATHLVTELRESAEHVRSVLRGLSPEPLVVRDRDEVWTTVKLLRRLAWHERGELEVLTRLLS
ncbi:MAG: hypothetical protein M3520_08625 [Actinomycetota bacterium]|nr:hypothetical protein [Actinomycetota bacterium]